MPPRRLADGSASAAYAAPERLLDGTATASADLYGLGATLFALLKGRPAFVTGEAEDLIVIMARIVRDPVPDLRSRGVPDPVALIVERLTAKAPAQRYRSAADAAAALQTAQRTTGRPVTRAVIEGAAPDPHETVVRPG